jgi:hypothetical protein
MRVKFPRDEKALGAEHEGIFFSLKRRNAVSNFLKRGAS